MKFLFLTVSLDLSSVFGFRQSRASTRGKLRTAIMEGDTNAIVKLSKYLNSYKKVSDPLGYDYKKSTEDHIARRIFLENLWFTKEEISVDDPKLTADIFLSYIHKWPLKFN